MNVIDEAKDWLENDGFSIKTAMSIMLVKGLLKEIERRNEALNPRTWSKEMHDAWHSNLPDTQKAFDAIRAIAES